MTSKSVLTPTEDLYEVLGVARDAPLSDIRQAFRARVLKDHPDRGGDPEVFGLLNAAWETLSDPARRAFYDRTGRTQKTAEESFLENFSASAGGERREGDGQGEGNQMADRLAMLQRREGEGQGAATHEEGFQAWLRARHQAGSVVTDQTILDKVGVSRDAYRPLRHAYAHEGRVVLRHSAEEKKGKGAKDKQEAEGGKTKEQQQKGGTSVADAASRSVRLSSRRLRAELRWGELLVNILYAPVGFGDVTALRVGENPLVAWTAEEDREREQHSVLGNGGRAEEGDDEEERAGGPSVGEAGVARVVAVGPGVKVMKEGDLVLPLRSDMGTWRTASIWKERDCLKLPVEVLPVEYAACAKELFTAYHLLQKYTAGMKAGDALICNGGNSLVVQALIQMAKILQYRTFVVVRRHSPETFETVSERLYEMGATRVFADDEPIRRRLLSEGQALPVLALDMVGGQRSGSRLLSALRPNDQSFVNAGSSSNGPSQSGPSAPRSRMVLFGASSGESFSAPWYLMLSSEVSIEAFCLEKFLKSGANQKKLVSGLDQIGRLVDAKRVVLKTREFALDEAEAAVEFWGEGGRIAKPLLRPLAIEEEKLAAEKAEKERETRERELKSLQGKLFDSGREREDGGETSGAKEMEEKPFGGPVIREDEETPSGGTKTVGTRLQKEALRRVELPAQRGSRGRGGASVSPSFGHSSAPAALVFLHGQGETCEEYDGLFRGAMDREESYRHVKTILPAAPCLAPDVKGEPTTSWTTLSLREVAETLNVVEKAAMGASAGELRAEEIALLAEVEQSCEQVARLLASELSDGVRANRLVLSGFSLGALVALSTAVAKIDVPLGGVILLGCPAPSERVLKFLLDRASPASKKTRLFLLTGSHDEICPLKDAERLKNSLETKGFPVTLSPIAQGKHEVGNDELGHLLACLGLLVG
uniref:J domain-containing protein n=1 Tax=Chromera velia CCMP2878 TaxID=1169474 RepID=A0A0G4GCB1_9ALVE|eukprot:Cvel_4507.t1-p1 / transcript=Cvel_4507.t1 / gene=Cvel_4507 / organism=Chromera_velia_CCMP2878 / gene_product=Trans-2-enoyl-CoA reductase, mitochondrial, putative / transcript_product=Trans-2-enoyl-CoA reductase, mitochondrial, putative / location=Cvel_scaffold197:50675-63298(+) / protein_length=934 / sequence_SO=supercontig / SO=protein_coding / is_pseudo=false